MAGQKLVKTPVYQQLNEVLRELIRSGEIKTGEQFLTERQIAERFEVSRATANKALSNLVSEGVLTFRKGVGTFVQGGTLDVDLRMLVSFTARAEAAGRVPATRVLNFEQTTGAQVPADIAERLQISRDDVVFDIERLRLADGQPVIHEQRYVVAQHVPGLDAQAAGGSLYGLWTDRFGLRIAGADQTIRAIALDKTRAEVLGTKRGAAALEVTALGQLESGAPLWLETTAYRSDVYAFENRLGTAARGGNRRSFELITP